MKNYDRIFVIVLDSLGIGAMPDSAKFGDIGVDTFGHILEKMGSLEIPNLRKLGMLNLHPAGKMAGGSGGKDSWLLWKTAGKEPRQRYHDRTLGDDGNQNRKTI